MIRIVKMHFREEEVPSFLALFEEVKDKIQAMPGCGGVKLLQDREVQGIMFTYSYWRHPDDLENYRTSALFKETWAKTKALFEVPAQAWSVEEVG